MRSASRKQVFLGHILHFVFSEHYHILSSYRCLIVFPALLALSTAGPAVYEARAEAPFLQTAMDALARATTSSEVLSLNLSGLAVLLALKVGVVAYSMFTTGASARSSSSPSYSSADLTGGMCFIMWTGGEEDKLDCIARAACESPENSADLARAAKWWHAMHQVIQVIPYSEKYNEVIDTVNMANLHRKSGGSCDKFSW
jgi:hypothetical protein